MNVAIRDMQKNLVLLDAGKVGEAQNLLRQKVADLGNYSIQAVKAKTATQAWTEDLIKQDIHIGKAVKSRQVFNDTLREQFNLQKMLAVQWTQDISGNMRADIIVPKGTNQEVTDLTSNLGTNLKRLREAERGSKEYALAMDVLKARMGLFNQVLGSVGDNLVKWGKNTQWAGRQLTVGFTVPFLAFGAAAAITAYKVNQEFTRVVKVYNFMAQGAAQAAEKQQLQTQSMQMATQVAHLYGKAVQETISIEADLAATGLQGQDLIKSTAEVQRAATLGEMDYQNTVKATIALQSVYGESWRKTGGIAKNTADAFNYMNSIENATSLTMQDFVDAIPRIAGPLHALGGNLQDMGVLLTGMKAGGIDATIGANALKSSLGSLIHPSSGALKVLKELTKGTVDLGAIVNKHGGNYFQTMVDFSAQLTKTFAGLDEQTKNLNMVKIIEALFGKQQYARILSIVNGLGQVNDATTQVGEAFKVSQAGVVSWSNTAQGELRVFRQSASGQFKIALESLKAQLVNAGEPFLKLGTFILNHFVEPIIKGMNKLPGPMKMFASAIFIAAAAAGPLIMMAGLFANLIGNVIKMTSSLLRMTSGFKALTPQEQAAKILAEQSTVAWTDQAVAAKTLAGTIMELTSALKLMSDEQAILAGRSLYAPGKKGMVHVQTPPKEGSTERGSYILSRNTKGDIVRSNGTFISNQDKANFEAVEARQKKIADASEKAAVNWKGIAKYAGAASIAMTSALMIFGGVGNGGMMGNLITAAFLASSIGPMLLRGLKSSAMKTALTDFKTAFSAGKGEATGIGGFVAGLKNALPAATALGQVIARFAGPVGVLAGAVFVLFKIHSALSAAKQKQDDLTNSAKNWADMLGFVYSESGKITDAQGNQKTTVEQMAADFGKANHAAAENLRTLKKMGDEQGAINAAIQEGVKARLHGATGTQAQQVVGIALKVAGFHNDQIDKIMKDQIQGINWDDLKQIVDLEGNALGDSMAKSFINGLSQSKWETVWRAFSGGNLNAASKEAAKNAGKEFWNAFDNLPDTASKVAFFNKFKARIDALTSTLYSGLSNNAGGKFTSVGFTSAYQIKAAIQDTTALTPSDFSKKYGQYSSAIRDIVSNLNDSDISKIKNGSDAVDTLTKAIVKSATGSDSAGKHIHTLAGVMDLLNVTDADVAASTDKTTAAIVKQANAAENASLTASDYENSFKSAMSTAQSNVLSLADSVWSQYTQAQTAALQKSNDNMNKAFDKQSTILDNKWKKRIDASNQYYDNIIKRIQDQISAEQQLADMANKNIDYNTALNTGQFDTAAKTLNDMAAAQDASANQDEITRLTNLKDARAKSLQSQADLDKAALQKKKDLFAEESAAKSQALQQQLEMTKRNLDLQLAAVKAHIPDTKKAYDDQVKQIEKIYQGAGVNLSSYGVQWGKYIGDNLTSSMATAVADLGNTVNWTKVTSDITGKFAANLGLTTKQWITWIESGHLPAGATLTPASLPSYSAKDLAAAHGRHGGGPIGGGSQYNSLAGRSPSSRLSQDEVLLRAQVGEYVVDANTHKKLGTGFLDKLSGRHSGGPVGPGPAGYIWSTLVGMAADVVDMAMLRSTMNALGVQGPVGFTGMKNAVGGGAPIKGGKSGKYGGVNLSAEQLRNAGIILGVGRSMGASSRDEIVALMTAMQESGLRNVHYGDRDSLGLFQQRPSQGWGTPAQVLDPRYAAGKFFRSLLSIKGRDGMPLTLEAQAVQRSAYPYAYAPWQPMASAVVQSMLPSMRTGGVVQYDNTIANLHKKETVLTAPLSASLNRGIQNIEKNGGSSHYDVTIDLRGAKIDSDVDIEKAIDKALSKRESKKGRVRRVGD